LGEILTEEAECKSKIALEFRDTLSKMGAGQNRMFLEGKNQRTLPVGSGIIYPSGSGNNFGSGPESTGIVKEVT
jgi:hypothetical protein